jgi:membrane-bound lytic murein transglycosylase B
MRTKVFSLLFSCALFVPNCGYAMRGEFNIDRWYDMLDSVRARAASENISESTIKSTLHSPAFIPSIVKSDKNQAEFKLTLDGYLSRVVNPTRIAQGKKMRATYPTMLSRVENKYGVPPHVMLAFWGMESNYGAVKSRHKLIDAFLTQMYDGRRETFFGNQLIALMKIADTNKLEINNIHGSWAGAMGHFQFIPTTLAQYGADGNSDGRIDIINNIGDAMFSAGNYLNKLGWNKNERIVRRVILPADFDVSLLDGKTKLTLPQWSALGVTNPDGTVIPQNNMTAGLVADTAHITAQRATVAPDAAADSDVAPMPVITAYLTYPNFYRIKKWNNSNWYAIAIANLADELH